MQNISWSNVFGKFFLIVCLIGTTMFINFWEICHQFCSLCDKFPLYDWYIEKVTKSSNKTLLGLVIFSMNQSLHALVKNYTLLQLYAYYRCQSIFWKIMFNLTSLITLRALKYKSGGSCLQIFKLLWCKLNFLASVTFMPNKRFYCF